MGLAREVAAARVWVSRELEVDGGKMLRSGFVMFLPLKY